MEDVPGIGLLSGSHVSKTRSLGKCSKDVRDVFENPMFHDPQNWTIINLGTKDQEAVPLLADEC